MPKNNLNNDVVHHMKIMLQTQRKTHLPSVGIACVAGASHLSSDSPNITLQDVSTRKTGNAYQINSI